MTETLPTLYILMRNDMESMNAGKAMAQASHASNAFVKHANEALPDFNLGQLFPQWKLETEQGFGTVLVLAVNEKQMRQAVETSEVMGLVSGVVHDPTYPLRDGDTTHFLPVDTCAYVFADRANPMVKAVLGNFPLHP